MKQDIGDLALFGGGKLFPDPLHVTRPTVGSKDIFLDHVNAAWDRLWFTNDGPLVRELESQLERELQVDHCVLTSNGTSAMSLVIQALGLKGEVILPSFTFVSTAHALQMIGIKPVFADIDATTWSLDVDHCRALITPETSAIIATHLFGDTADIEALEALCRSENIPLLFDSAHAFGCTHHGKPVGGFGVAEIFSFHATKTFHTFEGGAATTNDEQLAARLRKMRNFGFSDFDHIDTIGTNAKLSEIHAAMGLTNLAVFDDTLIANAQSHDHYAKILATFTGLTLRTPPEHVASNHHYVVAEVDHDTFGLSRDNLLQILHAENILARRYFYPGTHRCAPYAESNADAHLPVTENLADRIIQFPGGASIPQEDITKIGWLLAFLAANANEITARMNRLA